jgi:hypothetical protein
VHFLSAWLLLLVLPMFQASGNSGIKMAIRFTQAENSNWQTVYISLDRKRMEFRNSAGEKKADGAKPCGILNVSGFYSPLLAMFDHAVEERFLKPENLALVLARESPAELLQALEEWRPIHVEKWLSRETR